MYSGHITIDGFTFNVLGDASHEDGVIVPPNADLDNPAYMEALKTALKAYRYTHMVHVLRMVMYDFDRTGKHYQDVSEVINALIELPQQSIVNIPDGLISSVRAALDPVNIAKRREEAKQREKQSRRQNKAGYVYLVQSDTGYYKIGRTKNPDNRLETFKLTLPFVVDYVVTLPADDMYALERELHEQYASKRVNGEWFALDSEDVEDIKDMAS